MPPIPDHAGSNSNKGPSWVAGVVNAIGDEPVLEFRRRSSCSGTIGAETWYDSVRAAATRFVGLGIRVPCIIISPYAKAGYVSHTQYEFGSVLRLIEETFKLPSLGPAAGGYTDMPGAQPR